MDEGQLEILIKALVEGLNREHSTPMLEADLQCYLYHLILMNKLIAPNRLYACARVHGAKNPNSKFDLAIGEAIYNGGPRPIVKAEAILELKMFAPGFTTQANRVHLEHILNDDLPGLGALDPQPPLSVEVILDCGKFLSSGYNGLPVSESVREVRNGVSPLTKIVFVRQNSGSWQSECI